MCLPLGSVLSVFSASRLPRLLSLFVSNVQNGVERGNIGATTKHTTLHELEYPLLQPVLLDVCGRTYKASLVISVFAFFLQVFAFFVRSVCFLGKKT